MSRISVHLENPYAEWLKEKRRESGLSLRALARKAQDVCTPSYIGSLENGKYVGKKGNPTQPDEIIVRKLAVALGASVNEALAKAGYPIPDEDESTEIARDFENTLHEYRRLSNPARKLVNRHFTETIKFLLEVEEFSDEDDPPDIKDISPPDEFKISSHGVNKLETEEMSDEEFEKHEAQQLKKKKSSARKDEA